MTHKIWPRVLSWLMMVSMAISLSSPGAVPTTASGLFTNPQSQPAQSNVVAAAQNPNTQITTASDTNLKKFDSALQGLARAGGNDMVMARVLVSPDFKNWPGYVQALPLALPDDETGLPVYYARLQAGNLAKMASLKDVVYASVIEKTGPVPRFRDPDQSAPTVTDAMRARLKDLRDHPVTGPQSPASTGGWWDVGPNHESKLAWAKGFTGNGVTVADIDSGVDFCHADLYGTWKTYDSSAAHSYTYAGVPNYLDYYNGWPEMLSPVSNYLLFFDTYFNGQMTDQNTFLYGISKFADTRTSGVGDTISFDGNVYITTGTAFPGTAYHIGYHPDTSLERLWWGERIAVLVVDEDGDGVYDTVYVDLNDNHDFSDDKPANMQDPAACWDANGDGYNDLSGGLVYFIADGQHWPTMMDWWYNAGAYGPPPSNGDLVAFMFDDILGPAEAHGTFTAGNIVGQGRIDGDPSVYGGVPRPVWKPSGVGGMVQGGGKDARLIAIGDSYWNFNTSTIEAWLFSAFGPDGYGDSNDGAQITSNSYGTSDTDNDEWDNRSRLITRINTRTSYRGFANTYGMSTAFVVSTGNGAPGYGTVTSADASTSIGVGASTQFGSTGDFDSISGPDQIVWGDMIPWSNRGPSAVGHLAPQVSADGAFAAGDITTNGGFGDGWVNWASWGGTSRSTPVAVGNLALIYDAWKQRTGVWPTWEQARELLMNGANDQDNDVLVQGAGSVNADRSTDIAAGLFGVQVSPSAWYPGVSPGATGEPIAFAQVITPGGTDSQIFTVTNNTTAEVEATLDATYLTKISSKEFDVTADQSAESPYSFTRPDYLFDVSQYTDGSIPADTVLMVAEVLHPFSEFDPGNDNNDAATDNFRVLWYSWDDINGNGRLWQDANGTGAVNDGEIDAGEYIRFTYGYGHAPYIQAALKDPLTRWKSGIFLGLQHRNRITAVNHLHIRVTFYRKSDFSWLSFPDEDVDIPAGSSAAFTANANIPANTPYGLYEGAIELNVPNDGSHADYHAVIPVVISVGFDGDLQTTPVTLGGQAKQPTRYDNSYAVGAQDWSWRAESGDWRFYYLNQSVEPVITTTTTATSTVVVGPRMVVRDQWNDTAPQTDFDTLIFGPTLGPYVAFEGPFGFNFGDFSVTDPATFGPYRLEQTAGSANYNTGAGVWAFQTATGGNVEYVTTPLDQGLNEVVQHTVRWQGDQIDVPFTKSVSNLTGPTSLEYTNYFQDHLNFSSTANHTLAVDAFGLSESEQDFNDLSIHQDPTNGNFCDFAAGGIYTHTLTLAGVVANLGVHVEVGANDLDVFLLYDSNGDGQFSCPGDVIASSTQSAGFNEDIQATFPNAGNYMVLVQGWAVNPDPSLFSWYYTRTDLDNSIQIKNADLSIGPGNDASFDLYNTPAACSNVRAACNQGILYIGFSDAPRLYSIPITVNYSPDLQSGSSKSVDLDEAVPGTLLTYSILVANTSDITATNVMVTDTLPAEVTFSSVITPTAATYDAGANAVMWTGDIPAASAQVIQFDATVNPVSDGTIIANNAEVNNGLGNVFTLGPAETFVHSADLSASSKVVDPTDATPGSVLTYTVTVMNTGVFTATNAVFTDTIPANTSFVDAGPGAVYDAVHHAVVWHGLVGASDQKSAYFHVVVDSPLPAGTQITNMAVVGDGMGATWETNEVTTDIHTSDLSASQKTSTAGDLVSSNETITFTLFIRNTGDVSSNAMMTDTLPAGLTLVGDPVLVSGPGSVSKAGNTVYWNGTLLSGYTDNQAVVRYVAHFGTLGICKVFTNTALITDDQGNSASPSLEMATVCIRQYWPIIYRMVP